MKSEQRVVEPGGGAGAGQQVQLDHSQDVAGVEQPEHLASAQLEPDLQSEGDCEHHQETLPGSWMLTLSSPPNTLLVVVSLQPDSPPGLDCDEQAQQPEQQTLRQSPVGREEVGAGGSSLPGNTEVYPAVEEIVSSVLHCQCSLTTSRHHLSYVVLVRTTLMFELTNIKREERDVTFVCLGRTQSLATLITLPVAEVARRSGYSESFLYYTAQSSVFYYDG